MLFDWTGGGRSVRPGVVETDDELHEIYERVENAYRDAMIEANAYVTDGGGTFHHFLQPNLYIQDERSPHEERVMVRDRELHPGLEHTVRIGYPSLRKAAASARAQGVASADLTRVLEERPWKGEVYFDRAHVNHHGNALLARHMLEAMFD